MTEAMDTRLTLLRYPSDQLVRVYFIPVSQLSHQPGGPWARLSVSHIMEESSVTVIVTKVVSKIKELHTKAELPP